MKLVHDLEHTVIQIMAISAVLVAVKSIVWLTCELPQPLLP